MPIDKHSKEYNNILNKIYYQLQKSKNMVNFYKESFSSIKTYKHNANNKRKLEINNKKQYRKQIMPVIRRNLRKYNTE